MFMKKLFLSQSQHVLHVVPSRFLADEPFGGAEGASDEGVAGVGAVGDRDRLTECAVDHAVLADDVAAADRVHTDGSFFANGFFAFAAMY